MSLLFVLCFGLRLLLFFVVLMCFLFLMNSYCFVVLCCVCCYVAVVCVIIWSAFVIELFVLIRLSLLSFVFLMCCFALCFGADE